MNDVSTTIVRNSSEIDNLQNEIGAIENKITETKQVMWDLDVSKSRMLAKRKEISAEVAKANRMIKSISLKFHERKLRLSEKINAEMSYQRDLERREKETAIVTNSMQDRFETSMNKVNSSHSSLLSTRQKVKWERQRQRKLKKEIQEVKEETGRIQFDTERVKSDLKHQQQRIIDDKERFRKLLKELNKVRTEQIEIDLAIEKSKVQSRYEGRKEEETKEATKHLREKIDKERIEFRTAKSNEVSEDAERAEYIVMTKDKMKKYKKLYWNIRFLNVMHVHY